MQYVAIGLVILIFIWRIVAGFKKGLVAEIISFFSLIAAALALMALLGAVGNYLDENVGTALQMLLILLVIGLLYKIVNMILSSIKLITKLPVIKSLDRILGALLGAVEALLIILIIIQLLKYFYTSPLLL